MLRLNSLDVEQCKLKLQIFKFLKKKRKGKLTNNPADLSEHK